jgi:hypothetical protein
MRLAGEGQGKGGSVYLIGKQLFHPTAISPVTAAEMRELRFSRRRWMLVWMSLGEKVIGLDLD